MGLRRACVVVPGTVGADVFRPAYLAVRQRDVEAFDVTWKVPAIGDACDSVSACGFRRIRECD
jgi:hypothetical protein